MNGRVIVIFAHIAYHSHMLSAKGLYSNKELLKEGGAHGRARIAWRQPDWVVDA